MYVAKVAIERICLLPNDLGRSFHGSLLRKKKPYISQKTRQDIWMGCSPNSAGQR